ncbi:MAG TPA: CoA ester lyase [Deltaproteobacteria bacterium]|nr:MAG: CoA ester lyase [Deltaproteobacteria bacterium]HDM78036.1 CoA ester lyase [Deltaproteobacteria bacterium]
MLTPRPRRSILSVPGNNPRMIKKALSLNADQIMLDLEDSVPVDEKENARSFVVSAFLEENWGDKIRSFRINGLDTPYAYRDIIDVVEKAGENIDSLIIPKVNTKCDVYMVSKLLDQIESQKGIKNRIRLEASIETAEGLVNAYEIAIASDRLDTLVFGISDYSASVNMKNVGISSHGDEEEIYPGHRYHFPLSRMIMAAKAANLLAIDAPYGNFKDPEGLQNSCNMAAALGCDGKWAIHPAQIDAINKTFSPDEREIQQAKKVLEAYEKAKKEKHGAVAIDGKMIDGASLRNAKRIYDQARAFGLLTE